MSTRTRPRLLAAPEHHGSVAVIGPDGLRLTHGELAQMVARRAASWGPARRVVLVEGGNRLDALVAHLAAVEHGHVSLLVPPRGADAAPHPLATAWLPDVECRHDGDRVHRETSLHDLHPDLAMLSSTSGSTGSPKLVRLSADNLVSNAAAIADYLDLGPGSRALTSLPLHYCYGLSVVHSHLLVGGSVVLTDASVVDAEFWRLAREHEVTSFAAVPYTFELLEGINFDARRPASLRQVTQAGGRMAPQRVVDWAQRGRRQGWDLVVMYGQTEATARMAWLPPHLAVDHPTAIGVAVPGGHLRVDPVAECDEPGVGELVYSGPNVMLGYAETLCDLARGAELTELRTGDLGRVRDGLHEVVGRRSRFAKIFGLRIDLDQLEVDLEVQGTPATLVASDQVLHAVSLVPDPDLATARGRGRRLATTVAHLCGLPAHAVRAHLVDELPRTSSGKVDRAALLRLAEARAADETSTPASEAPDPDAPLAVWITAWAGIVLGRDDADESDTFVSLGGDSLSYVELTVRLEERLGDLPDGWHTTPFAELAAAHHDVRPGERPRPAARLDTTIALRALAIVAIVAGHVDLVGWQGGAHLLLAVAGYNFARFQLGSADPATRVRHGLSTVLQVVVPAVAWVGTVAFLSGGYDASTALLLNGVLGSPGWDERWQLWFLEALVWTMLAALLLLSVPWVHRWERRAPFLFAVGLLLATTTVRHARVGVEADAVERYTTSVVAFLFVLGWCAARADTVRRKLVVSALAPLVVVGFFGNPTREAIVVVGVLALTWLSHLRLPRWGARPVSRVAAVLASYSLFVYLTHWQVYPPLEDAGHPWLALVASFVVGIGYGLLMRPVQRAVAARLTSGRPGAHHPNPGPTTHRSAHTIVNWRARRMPTDR
ncbi:AMP-binding protein [Nocardioides sp. Y6]|uniref:AMP-binding protein n=1 Tax=Nocardioides malaquae TaxID=2773426 RepID=A0ABR9RPC5_9ACTN|nr:AMP-binding protein [Nocardioides malaquae]MBE7323411.1 AMP-binding protein [Nocardioides malaquae]